MNMLEWIQTITSKTSTTVAVTIALIVFYFAPMYFAALSFLIVFLLFEPIKQFWNSYNNANQCSKKLHQLSEPEKAIIKRFLDEDRRELKFKWTDDNVKRLEEKKIITNIGYVIAFVSGSRDESDNQSDFTIQDTYFQVAKENYQTIFGAH